MNYGHQISGRSLQTVQNSAAEQNQVANSTFVIYFKFLHLSDIVWMQE